MGPNQSVYSILLITKIFLFKRLIIIVLILKLELQLEANIIQSTAMNLKNKTSKSTSHKFTTNLLCYIHGTGKHATNRGAATIR